MEIGVELGVCRTCLTSTKCELISLSGAVPYCTLGITYEDILKYCRIQSVAPSIKQEQHDQQGQSTFKFPTHICLRCSKALQVSYHFIKMLRQTDFTLQAQQAAHDLKLKSDLMDMDCDEPGVIDGIEVRDATTLCQDFSNKVPAGIYADVIKSDRLLYDYNRFSDEHSPVNINKEKENHLTGTCQDDEFYAPLSPSSYLNSNSTESHYNVTENVSNQNNAKIADDTSNELYFQDNLNNFVEEIKDKHRDIEDEINSSFISKYEGGTMTEESDSCMSCSSNENNIAVTATKNYLNDQPIRKPTIIPFGCQKCKYSTCYTESLRKHYKRTHNIEATAKMLCTPVDPLGLNIYHELTHQCPDCGWESHNIDSIKAHMIFEHNAAENTDLTITTNINCPLCARKFKNMRGLRVHLECIHNTKKMEKSNTEPFKCEKCEKSYPTKFSLSVHQRSCIEGPKRIDCNLCTKRYDSLRQYEAHLCKEHDVEMIHECEVCGKTFKNSSALGLHRKRHTERHFQCDLCPKNYINRAELKVHIERIHKKVSKVICSTCNASFTSDSSLRIHENKEHFKKLHKCNYCNYKCATSTCLKVHQYIHTGMPYRCKMCPKEYAFRRFMRRHSINVHGIELTETELADMFRQNCGYPSRYDTFGKSNKYSLDIPEVTEEDVEEELAEFGLKFDDIVKDLFNEKVSSYDELLNVF